jgi:hypothetical protein
MQPLGEICFYTENKNLVIFPYFTGQLAQTSPGICRESRRIVSSACTIWPLPDLTISCHIFVISAFGLFPTWNQWPDINQTGARIIDVPPHLRRIKHRLVGTVSIIDYRTFAQGRKRTA